MSERQQEHFKNITNLSYICTNFTEPRLLYNVSQHIKFKVTKLTGFFAALKVIAAPFLSICTYSLLCVFMYTVSGIAVQHYFLHSNINFLYFKTDPKSNIKLLKFKYTRCIVCL